MKPKGDIYIKGRSLPFGNIRVGLSKVERIAFHFLRGVGVGLIGFSVISLLFSYGPAIKEEIYYDLGLKRVGISQVERAVASDSVEKEAESYGVRADFSIVVPKIGATSEVVANVDPANESEYLAALEKGVAHAKGTYFPGQGKNIYLFSHSTDSPLNVEKYNAVFYLLRKLENGDRIILFFAGEKYEYSVSEKHVVSANDISWLSQKVTNETLVLQTCDPPGTNWRRLIVVAKSI